MSRDFLHEAASTRAYIGKHAADLANLLTAHAGTVYHKRGMIFPVVTSSTLHYIDRNPDVSLADISCALEHPHQVIAQRIGSLKKLGLLDQRPDPEDGRRQLLALTETGRSQARLLDDYIAASQTAIDSLSEEIGADLPDILSKAIESLKKRTFADRFDP